MMKMRKRKTLMAVALMMATAAGAADYGYLTFRSSDGALQSMPASGLSMKFQNGQLVATQGTQTLQLDATALSAMFFTASDATGIETVEGSRSSVKTIDQAIVIDAPSHSAVSIYGLGGNAVASVSDTSAGTLRFPVQEGIYIVSVNGTRTKIIVK